MAAAALPDTITALNELTPVCIKRLAIANIAFCIPAGIPSINITFDTPLYNLNSFTLNLQTSSSFLLNRLKTTKKADIYCAVILANATPSSAIPIPITNIRLRHTLTTPANERYISGFFVSPLALITALPKLYIAIAGIPSAYILKYKTAPDISSCFVFISDKKNFAPVIHNTHAIIPTKRLKINDVWIVFLTFSFCPAPSCWAVLTLTPQPMPIRNPVNNVTRSDVEPTAPSAS